MAEATTNKDPKTFSFADAIESKQIVMVSVHQCDARGCLGDCQGEDEAVLSSNDDDNDTSSSTDSTVFALDMSHLLNRSSSSSSGEEEESIVDLVSCDEGDDVNTPINLERQPSVEYVPSSGEEQEFTSEAEEQSFLSDGGIAVNDDLLSFIDDSSQSTYNTGSEPDENDSVVETPVRSPHPKNNGKQSNVLASSKSTKKIFQKQRDQLTASTFEEFNTKAFNSALTLVPITWSKRLLKTAGVTYLKQIKHHSSPKRTAHIELSCKVVDNEYRLRSTLLHEMCHAVAWLVDGIHHPPHGPSFRTWANRAMKKISDVEVTTRHQYEIAYKFAWKCINLQCGNVIQRQSRSIDVVRHCCGQCRGTLVEIESNSKNDVGITPKKKRPPSAFSLFVQQHSQQVRSQLMLESTSVSQAQVMIECGRLWKLQKAEKDASANDENTELLLDDMKRMSIREKGT